ncbi:iron-sulfur cluster assembly 1 homolog, mitochondrial isoform X2 [Struthio camelus]|uniref:iron-sulfur cluster assembly 1 homolog, mitochondrial isoform X2 n=1 Tax=Struthio camelus TaxID=8801 RepID=UPI0036040AB4
MASSVVRATVRAVSKRKLQATRAALTLTPSAVQKIKQLLKDKPEHVGVKVGVRTRGCNGLSYTLEYTKSKGDSDEEVVQDGPMGQTRSDKPPEDTEQKQQLFFSGWKMQRGQHQCKRVFMDQPASYIHKRVQSCQKHHMCFSTI